MSKPKNDRVQLHVEITRSQRKQLQAALKRLGYRTLSELIRDHVRRVIAEAKTMQNEEGQV